MGRDQSMHSEYLAIKMKRIFALINWALAGFVARTPEKDQ